MLHYPEIQKLVLATIQNENRMEAPIRNRKINIQGSSETHETTIDNGINFDFLNFPSYAALSF